MSLDLTNISHLDEIYHLADEFLANTDADEVTLESIEIRKRSDPETPLSQLVALKLARSKSIIINQFSREKPIHVSVIFAVYKEHQRILSSTEHPYGEDFLNRKIHPFSLAHEDVVDDLTLFCHAKPAAWLFAAGLGTILTDLCGGHFH